MRPATATVKVDTDNQDLVFTMGGGWTHRFATGEYQATQTINSNFSAPLAELAATVGSYGVHITSAAALTGIAWSASSSIEAASWAAVTGVAWVCASKIQARLQENQKIRSLSKTLDDLLQGFTEQEIVDITHDAASLALKTVLGDAMYEV